MYVGTHAGSGRLPDVKTDIPKQFGTNMSKPPPSGPHSDIDGVHQDELPNHEATIEAGQDPANLGLARGYGKGYPNDVDEEDGEGGSREGAGEATSGRERPI
jgi:hypothetical protein